MTLDEIRALLVRADPDIKHYFSMGTGAAYSYWEEISRLPNASGNRLEADGWNFAVHRYAVSENDAIADALFATLNGDDRTGVTETVDFEPETGYIHHIYTCQGV